MKLFIKAKSVAVLFLLAATIHVFGEGSPEKSGGSAESPVIFNAASTTDIINEAVSLFKEKNGIRALTNPASSGTLAHQLESGAEADIYISASKNWMDFVNELGIVSAYDVFAGNRLVLIAPSDTEKSSFTLTADSALPGQCESFLSMGDPAHVPAGKYAKQALEFYKWYEEFTPKILPATDVRSAMVVVEAGEADLGIVYETDAAASEKVVILSRFPEESHSPIVYYCALLEGASPEAELLYQFLFSGEAGKLFESHGFSLP